MPLQDIMQRYQQHPPREQSRDQQAIRNMVASSLLFYCLYGIGLVWHVQCANPEALRMFNIAFGEQRIASSFDSTASMDSAFEHEYANIQSVSQAESAVIPRFACASYVDGQEIGNYGTPHTVFFA